jgi:hypothetical protein
MNKTFIGLDICKNCVVAWVCDDPAPRDHKLYWREKCKEDGRTKKHDEDPLTFFYNRGGMAQLIKLGGDVWIFEPTGGHYSELIEKVAQSHDIEILRVAHAQSAHERASMKLPGKNDIADAYTLARYGQLYYGVDSYFIKYDESAREIKKIFLQLKTISRFRTPFLNRLKQQLSHEFPEAMNKTFSIKEDGHRAFIKWLLSIKSEKSNGETYWNNRYNQSIAPEYNILISDFTRELAQKIYDLDKLDFELTNQLKQLIYQDKFIKYHRIFDDFNFGLMLRAILLATVYPFEGNYQSISQFKKRIGCALDEKSSGDSESWKSGRGSALCRCEFYLYVSTVIKYKPKRPQSKVGEKIGDKHDSWLDQFNKSPENFARDIENRAIKRALKALEPLLDKSLLKLIETAVLQLNNEAPQKQTVNLEIRKKFSNLIIGKCIGFTGRLLYRELSRRL